LDDKNEPEPKDTWKLWIAAPKKGGGLLLKGRCQP